MPLSEENRESVDWPILIVDDDELVLTVLQATLEAEGFHVTTAPNAPQALRLLEQQQFALILTDQNMPEMTGLEFLARVKDLQPDATRVLITAALNLDTAIAAINKGEIYRFIAKPWLREELLATLRNGLQRYELIRRNAALQQATLAMNEKLARLNAALEEQARKVAEQNQALTRLNGALEHNLQRSVELCLKTMETFYPTLGSQARRAFGLCRAMAETLKLSDTDRQVLEISAWLHDIGLVGVPRRLIRKWEQAPHTLVEAERALLELHPVLGQELAGFVHHLEAVGVAIRAHHERLDGTGYPDRLAGEDIPWLARLLAVVVAYVESNFNHETTVEMLKQGRGSRFDPEAVRVLLRSLPTAVVPRKQREVLLAELQPGMVLARAIYTANGMLLIPDGQRLTEPSIDRLQSHNRVSPITQSLLVYC